MQRNETCRPITVLHVDDDPSLLELTRETARRRGGVEVRGTTDPDAALDALDGVDCVVGDSIMTGDGETFVVAARRRAPDLPLVLFTGKDWERAAADIDVAGADGYVQKGSADAFDALLDRIEAVATGGPGVGNEFPAGRGWTVVDRYDPETDGEFAVWFVQTVGGRAEFDALKCPPLFDVVDPEALVTLLESSEDVAVSFQYLDHQVGLNADGDLAIRPV